MLVYCANLLFNMINLLNLAIRVGNGTMTTHFGTGPITYLPAASSILRALNYSVLATLLTYRCEQTYKQSERILRTIDELLTGKKYNNDMKTSLLEFRNLVITRPIKFHAEKFFTVDYTLLVSVSSVVVTYTIIMLQSIQ
ncbi:uncharacterized protein LOC142980172 [Anticarsia gemmatalis]|uniref:uncharacterized protein LOC142980172 n=1 Tax=Anticarsia gemmatalis TaxID=129554 RepID=UPI003F766F5F